MLIVATGTETPILVHRSSGNDQHGRGDLLFLSSVDAAPIRVGDLIVYEVGGRNISVVHRVWRLHELFVDPRPTPQDLIEFSYCQPAREIE